MKPARRLGTLTAMITMLTMAAIFSTPTPAFAKGVALLVGIGKYQDNAVGKLDGPPHDVAALRDVLVQHWGFAAGDIRVLLDAQATRTGILSELAALKTSSRAGEPVFIYFSGHGTSALDTNITKAAGPLPHTSGALLPWDFPGSAKDPKKLMAGLIVGRTDLQPILRDLEATGRSVTVVFDSCYSGNAVRSVGRIAKTRHFPMRLEGADEFESGGTAKGREAPPPYPYRNVFFLAAASDSEAAGDLGLADMTRFPTLDGKPHGAFTDALLRAMSGQINVPMNDSGRISNGEIYAAVRHFMEQRAYQHTPQRLPELVEDRENLAQRPLLDGPKAPRPTGEATTGAQNAVRVRVANNVPPVLGQKVRTITGLQAANDGPAFLIQTKGGNLELLSPAGDLVGSYAQSASPSLLGRLRQQVWYDTLATGSQLRPSFNLQMETTPATRGGTFMANEMLAFSVQAAQPAHILLLNLDSEGKVSVLYPLNASEIVEHPAGRTLVIPGSSAKDMIRVVPPFGSEYLLAFAFATRPAWLQKIAGQEWLPGDAGLTQLADALADHQLKFGRAATTLRTLLKPLASGR
jgi:hypothetical protein